MTIPFSNPEDMLAFAQEKYEQYLPEVLSGQPNAIPSHLGIDCANEDDLDTMEAFGKTIGEILRKPTDDKDIVFVKLNEPLIHEGKTLPYLELIGPNYDPAQRRPTGFRSIVSQIADVTLQETLKIPSAQDPNIILRFQNKSAAELSGLGL